MHRVVTVVFLTLPLFGGTVYDCRLYDCDAAFARIRVTPPNPPAPPGAIANASGHAVWTDTKLHYYDGSVTTSSTADVAPDFHLFDLSDNNIIGWTGAPGSFFIKDTGNLDAFSRLISWDPSVAGGLFYAFGSASALRLSSTGNAILFQGVQTHTGSSGGPLVDGGLLVALALSADDLAAIGREAPAFSIRAIPEPSTVVALALALLLLRHRHLG
ncbi:MAG: hypothetical protein U0Q16_18640 [Bryobacteraceae bacterium]